MKVFNEVFRAWVALLVFGIGAQAQSYVNFEGKQTSPIRLSADGKLLFAVNTPDARLSVFDVSAPDNPILVSEIPVGLEPVSVNPRNLDEVWVVNEVSDSISVVSVSRHAVTDTIYVKDEPSDVVFANGKAFVTAARNNRVVVLDATTHVVLTNIAVFGENPRAMAVSPDGTKVYAAFALSGNRTTLIPPDLAPPQITTGTPPMNPALPAPPQVGLIVDATDPAWTNVVKYTLPDNDVVEIDTTTHAINRYFSHVGTVNLAIATQPGSGHLFVANTDARNRVHFEPGLRGHFVENRLSRIDVTNGAVSHFDLNPGIDYGVMPNLPAKTNALAQPTAIVFNPTGAFAFVAAFGTDRIAKINAADGSIVARIDVGSAPGSSADPRTKRGPRGLALGLKGTQRLYVLNRISNTISVLDVAGNLVVREIPAGSYDPTPEAIRLGRGFLYDAKLSGNGTASCASCHVDAEMDLLAWDLGDPQGATGSILTQVTPAIPGIVRTVHPMKGPMTTQTLRGLSGQDPLHWRGDRTNFLHFSVAFADLLGGSPLAAQDMEAYRAFIDTIVFQPNPNQNLDRTLPTSFAGGNPVAGRNSFFNELYQPILGLSCTTCHTGPPGSGSDGLIFDRQALQESQDFKVPQLRNVYQKANLNSAPGAASIGGFGMLHDGMEPDLFTFLSRPVFGTFANDTTRKKNIAAFVLCFDTGTAPAVGYARTLTSATVENAAFSNDWTLLENQARSNNVDLIVKGTVDGRQRGLLYQPGSNSYRSDKTDVGLLTRAQLKAKIQSGDVLTLMGVPVGSGRRMGIERRQDGVMDGDQSAPQLRISLAQPNTIIAWPTNAAGFLLETTTILPGTNWSPQPGLRVVVDSEFAVTNTGATTLQFFRLKGL
jgi:YVTN family beta-propeller protein